MHKPSAWMIVAGVACIAAGIAGASRGATAPAGTAAPQAAAFAFTDVRVFDGERVIERANVLVRDGLIVSVGEAAVQQGVAVIDGAGRTLLPGLIDSHTHAFGNALEVSGTITAGAPFPWAGAIFFPAATPMTPADVSRFTEIVFKAMGDGREQHVMVFATRLGNIPASQPFTAGPEWQEFVMPLAAFSGIDGSDLRGILFTANPAPGAFRFVIDDVRLR